MSVPFVKYDGASQVWTIISLERPVKRFIPKEALELEPLPFKALQPLYNDCGVTEEELREAIELSKKEGYEYEWLTKLG